MAQLCSATAAFLVLLVQCKGLSLHNCGGHNESSNSVPQPRITRKANAGSALSASMGSYPGTSSGVSGVVSVTVDGGLLKVAYTLTGLDASLTLGGLHIHSGSGTDVCSDASLPGGHYFASGYADPWFTTWSKTAGDTTAVGSFAVGASGYDTLADNEFHAVVVHGAGGARVACGFLQYYGALSSSIGSYPGTSSGVSGTFTVSVYTGVLEVSYTLDGLASSETSGGLHIHSGSGTGVCSDASLPGGHYFATGYTDPWFTTWSKTAGSTSSSGTFIVGASGYDTLAENYLHAVVLHAASGARIGCGYLGTYSTVSSELAAAMGPYPGTFSGISGVVSATVMDSGLLRLGYYLDGLEASETSGGLHIHTGSGTDVCSDASLPGGHYFASGYADPWFTTWSKTAGDTTAVGSFAVGASGYDTLADNEFHAVVVHGAGGARVGCGFLQYYGALSASIGSYPGTSSGVSGMFTVSVYTGVLEVYYTLDGLALGETSGGLHIHSGSGPFVCTDATLPAGHYFATGYTDPWFTTWSKTASSTSASGTFIVGASGYDTLAENYLHAVVLHAASGARTGCGYLGTYLTEPSELAASIGPYPGTFSGISGVVSATVMDSGTLRLGYYLEGLEASETSGGLHIHSGSGTDVCSDASLPGGHYFASGFADPWFTTWSKTAGSTVAKGSFTVGASGYDTIHENLNHAVVLHAASGARIGCGYAGAGKSLTAAMGSYPGTSSGMSGTVTVTVSMGLLSVSYTLTGLSSSDTSGGLHIHSGYGASVCSDASLPGGHYFATGYTDPWYTTWTKAVGATAASGSFTVLASGYDTLAENFLHAVVAHAGSGARIGCGVLGGSTATPFATGDPHLQNVHGERFDLMKPGKHLLIQIPRMRPENTLLRVEAEAQRLGEQCTDMYFQELNVTGAWAEAKQTGGFHYHAHDVDGKPPHWARFGNVQLKVSHGRTQQGAKYLNFYVKDLMRAGYAVGGLLGDDDHTEAATPPQECVRHLALVNPVGDN